MDSHDLSASVLAATDRPSSPTGSLHMAADPAAHLRLFLDPSLSRLTPLHWAYELLGAIRNADTAFVVTQVNEPSRGFTLDMLTQPLGGAQQQTMLHVAALLNQGPSLCALLAVADRAAGEAAAEEALNVRAEMLEAKGVEADIVAYQRRVGAALDRVERVRAVLCVCVCVCVCVLCLLRSLPPSFFCSVLTQHKPT